MDSEKKQRLEIWQSYLIQPLERSSIHFFSGKTTIQIYTQPPNTEIFFNFFFCFRLFSFEETQE